LTNLVIVCAAIFMGLAVASLAVAEAAPPFPQSQEPQARPCKVLHLHVRGDLDSMRLAHDFAEALSSGRADGVEVVVLELSGNRWRADVVHAMAKAMTAGTSPGAPAGAGAKGHRVLALLDDESDRRVGFGQAALALLADACAMTPRTVMRFEGPDDLRATASPETDWERVDRELQGLVYLSAKDRQADVLLNAVLPRPSGPLWAIPGADASTPWRISTNHPADSSAVLIVPAAAEGRTPSVSFDYTTASRLGVINCQAKDCGQLLASQGLRARPILRKELVSGLDEARAQINRLIRQMDDAVRLIDIDLEQSAKLRGQDASKRKREAGARAMNSIVEAGRHLIDAEAVMTQYPELLAALPPGRTPVGQDPEKHPLLWRYRFQDFRDEISRLQGEAEALTRTP
jgi:hypothetical protein